MTGQFRLGGVRRAVAWPRRSTDGLGLRARIGFTEGMVEFTDAPPARLMQA